MLVYTPTDCSGRTDRRRHGAFALLAAAALAGLVFLLPAPASAATPDCFAVDFAQACVTSDDQQFTDPVLCDFPVEVTVTGSTRYRPFFASDGTGAPIREELHVQDRATIVNTATGRSFTDGNDFNVHVTYLPDGSVEFRLTGLTHNAQVDTGQRLLHQSGYHSLLFDADGQLLDEVFDGNFQSEAAFPGEVCPILAQPA